MDSARPCPIYGAVGQLSRPAKGLDAPELGRLTIKGPLECKHEEAIDLSREKQYAAAIKITRHLSDSAFHEVRSLAAIGVEGLRPPAGATPDPVRSGSNVGSNQPPGVIDVSIPPRRNCRIAHTAPTGLIAAEVDCGMSDDAARAASAAIPIETGNESRAGHSNFLQKRSTTAALAGRRGSEYFPTMTGRMRYILNQEPSLWRFFIFLVAIPARGRSQ